MAEAVLVEEDQRLAQALVKFLDKNGLPLKSAFWIYEHDADRWRFVVCPKEKRDDYTSFYLSFAEAIHAAGKSDDLLALDRVKLVPSDSPLIKVMVKSVGPQRGVKLRVNSRYVDGTFVEDAWVYRLSA